MNAFTVDDSMQRSRREDGTARGWAMARRFLLGLSLALACQCAVAQAMYRIKPLGHLGDSAWPALTVVGLNGRDEVAGTTRNARDEHRAFLWRNDGRPMVDLGPDGVGAYSYAQAINASGLVSGGMADFDDRYGDQYAFESYGDGTPARRFPSVDYGPLPILPQGMNDLGQLTGAIGRDYKVAFLLTPDATPNGTIVELGGLGGEYTIGAAINNSGQVAGISSSPVDSTERAFVWMNNGRRIINLGTLGGRNSEALFINASGQVAGFSDLPGNTRRHVFFWRNDGGRMHDLGTLGGANSYPNALNDSGQIAGDASKYNGATHAFVWMNDGTAMKDLGTFGGTESSANDINFSGQVTGDAALSGNAVWHAFLWRNNGTKIQDLNKLIDPTDPLKPYITLTSGLFINESGDILANGTDSRTGEEAVPYLLQGTVLILTPRSLAFGSHPINTTSAAKSVTVMNTSAKAVAITSIALSGSAPGQFASTNNCGKSLLGHATCTIKVTFKPTTRGAKSALLKVNGGGGGLRTVTLTGTGT
jgi:probable HAF family extracellular repeat protein